MVELKDVVDQLSNKGADAAAVQKDQSVLYRPWKQELLEACAGNSFAAEKLGKMLLKSNIFEAWDVTTTDLGPVRIDSLFPTINLVENRDHPFLNVLRSKPRFRATDYSIRIVEENAGTDILPFFNLDGAMPAVVDTALSARYNTLGAVGQAVKVSWMASELAQQGPYNRDEDAAQLRAAMNRLDRSMNQYAWTNTEQTGEGAGQVPQPGGFYTRSTTNVSDVVGSNLTDAIITDMVNDLGAVFGYNGLDDMVMCIPRNQLPIIRSLMINRFPGTTSLTKLAYDDILKAKQAAYGYPIDAIYEDNNGKIIPMFVDDQLAQDVAILFRAKYPALAGFQWRGTFGPHLVQLPIALFTSYAVLFDIMSIVDPLTVSRSTRTSVGS